MNIDNEFLSQIQSNRVSRYNLNKQNNLDNVKTNSNSEDSKGFFDAYSKNIRKKRTEEINQHNELSNSLNNLTNFNNSNGSNNFDNFGNFNRNDDFDKNIYRRNIRYNQLNTTHHEQIMNVQKSQHIQYNQIDQYQNQRQYSQRQLNNPNRLINKIVKIQEIDKLLCVLYEQLNTSNLINNEPILNVIEKIKEMCDEHNKKINDWYDSTYYENLNEFERSMNKFNSSSDDFINNYPLKFG